MTPEGLFPLASLPFHLPCSQFPPEESQGIPLGPFTGTRAGPVTPVTRRDGFCSPTPLSCSFLCSFSPLPVTPYRFCTQISTGGRAEEAAELKKKICRKTWKPAVTHQANEMFCCHDHCLKPAGRLAQPAPKPRGLLSLFTSLAPKLPPAGQTPSKTSLAWSVSLNANVWEHGRWPPHVSFHKYLPPHYEAVTVLTLYPLPPCVSLKACRHNQGNKTPSILCWHQEIYQRFRSVVYRN